MEFRLFLEANITYIIPKNKRELMYDFYMLQMLYKTPSVKYQRLNKQGIMVNQPDSDFRDMDRDEMIDYQLEEIAQKLIPYLKKELLVVVYFAIASELRHSWDMSVGPKGNSSGINRSILRNFERPKFENPRIDAPRSVGVWSREDRVAAYERSLLASSNKTEFVLAAREAFRDHRWDPGYGGESWVAICEAWINLSKASSIPEMMIQIDHVYDLQHNTGSVLDKSDSYLMNNSSSWINAALDHKASIDNPIKMINFVSSSMKKIALPAIKAKFNTTLYMNNFKNDENIEKLSKSVKVIDNMVKSLPHSMARVLFDFDEKIDENIEDLRWYISMISKRNNYEYLDEYKIAHLIMNEKYSHEYWNLMAKKLSDDTPVTNNSWFNRLPKLSSDVYLVSTVVRSMLSYSSFTFKKYTMYNDEQVSAIEYAIKEQPSSSLDTIIDHMTIES